MPRKLKITLWVAIGLLAATPAIIMVGYWAAGPVHMLTEAGFVMALFVCPIALVVGAVKALRFKSTPAS